MILRAGIERKLMYNLSTNNPSFIRQSINTAKAMRLIFEIHNHVIPFTADHPTSIVRLTLVNAQSHDTESSTVVILD